MALDSKKLNENLFSKPLTKKELKIIKQIENYIDEEIQKKYNGNPVKINLKIAKFESGLDFLETDYCDIRKKVMFKELLNRYTKNNWIIEEEYNKRDEEDFLVFTPVENVN